MIKNIFDIIQKKVMGFGVILLLFGLFSFLPLFWNEPVEDSLIDLQFKIRGSRELPDDIVVVFIGAEDIKDLGGWPITRDYYGYMTYILDSMGAKVVGIDVLFNKSDNRHPEYDAALSEFFQITGNVCLPSAFSELSIDSKLSTGKGLILPMNQLQVQGIRLGFSNFSKEVIVRKVPLVANFQNGIMFSFGCQLAFEYWGCEVPATINENYLHFKNFAGNNHSFPVDKVGRLRLNHFGDTENLTAISFVDLLQKYQENPKSLNFDGKLVLIAVTAPGIANLKATPLSKTLPASLIHATVAENLIHQSYLREFPVIAHWIFIGILLVFLWLIGRINHPHLRFWGSIGIIFGYWVVAIVIFRANYILPLFYPTLAGFSAMAYSMILQNFAARKKESSIKALLQNQIETKQDQIDAEREKLAEIHQQLQRETATSERVGQLADKRQEIIFTLEKELRDLQTYILPEKNKPQLRFSQIIHSNNSPMTNILGLVATVSSDDIPVLITGETGTGKEMIANAIHQTSKRRNAPFVAINCGALSETLLESELFGHEKGSFTGAHSRRRGRFELANGGTIFLDEISETTPTFQSKLLRILQEGTFERLGSEQTLKVDVRIVAATNKNLQKEMGKERFRSDLFYRLNGFPITLPPLRERKLDIPILADHFLKKYNYHSISGFSDTAMKALQGYKWPGNVRELENIVRRAAILALSEEQKIIQEGNLPDEILSTNSIENIQSIHKPLEIQVLEMLRSLKFSRSAISQTAKVLGNRDRGTITEYFRGICFEQFVKTNFDIEKTAKKLADSNDEVVIRKVKSKIEKYLDTIKKYADSPIEEKSHPVYKGLPKKYHPYVTQIFKHLTSP